MKKFFFLFCCYTVEKGFNINTKKKKRKERFVELERQQQQKKINEKI